MRPLLLSAMLAVGCAASAPRNPARPASVAHLAPVDELAVLLSGTIGAGTPTVAIEGVAIAPLRVEGGGDRAWIGEGVAALLADELSRSEGLSPLPSARLSALAEESSKGEVAAARLAELGTQLGARWIVTGTASTKGERIAISLRAHDVREGRVVATFEGELAGDWSEGLIDAGRTIAKSFGKKAPVAPPLPRAGAEQIEWAARAASASRRGAIEEAVAGYARAFATPTSALQLEADYVEVLRLGHLDEEAIAFARSVLAKVPEGPEHACARAHVYAAATPSAKNGGVRYQREHVRTAATCGDASVVVHALMRLTRQFAAQDYPVALEALRRARALLGTSVAATWASAEVTYAELWLASVHGGGVADESTRWAQLSRDEATLGNRADEARAAQNAIGAAWRPSIAIDLADRSMKATARAGGLNVEDAVRARDDVLRGLGRISDADAALIEAIRARLTALIAFYGALPAELATIDDELFFRTKVPRPTATPRALVGAEALRGKAELRAAAALLQIWRDKIIGNSSPLAKDYDALLNHLRPAAPDPDYEAQLGEAKLPLATILASTTSPPIDDGSDRSVAMRALFGWFSTLSGKVDKRRDVAHAASRLAEWIDSPWARRESMLLEARVAAEAGDQPLATKLLTASEPFAPNEATWRSRELDYLADWAPSPSAKAALLEARVAFARQLDPSSWVEATARAERAKLAVTNDGGSHGVARLFDEAKSLEKQDAWNDAAYALAQVVALYHQAVNKEGSDDAVKIYRRRVEDLDQLGDAQRSSLARAELLGQIAALYAERFRGAKKSELAKDAEAKALVLSIGKRARALATEGRLRDAIDLVQEIDPAALGDDALIIEALAWADRLKGSADYEHTVAALHKLRASSFDEGDANRLTELRLARDAYMRAQETSSAALVAARLVRAVKGEDDLWREYRQCVATAGTASASRAECTSALGDHFLANPTERTLDRDAIREAATYALTTLPYIEQAYLPIWRQDQKGSVCGILVRAGLADACRPLAAEVEHYYTVVAPNPYQWATWLARVSAEVRVGDPLFALAMDKQFDAANGASGYWRGGDYAGYADNARRAGDADAERMFLEKGEALAAPWPMLVTRYYAYPAQAAREGHDWKVVADAYARVATYLESHHAPAERVKERAFRIAEANAASLLGDAARAKKAIERAMELAAVDAKEPEPTALCLDSLAYELGASIARASSRCAEAAPLLARAAELRTACAKQGEHRVDAPGASWTDGDGYTKFRADNACGAPISGDALLVP